MNWTPDSWRTRPIAQQPAYDDAQALRAACVELAALPPLVVRGEVNTLRGRLVAAGRGEAFLLQGGDCAERFADCNRVAIETKLKILLQMSLVLTWGARLPVVRVGRLAGQYAKPRSRDTETIDGVELPSYRGDLVHDIRAETAARRPDPVRLVRASHLAAATLNYTRALLQGGFADLHHPDHWNLTFVRAAANRTEYEDMVQRILDALDFVESTGVRGAEALRTVEFYSSHEGLVLDYEEAHTIEAEGKWYNLGTHFPWIGDRTRQVGGAHVEYFRGVENPIGLKVGPGVNPADLTQLLEALEPANREGRLMLITRLGSDCVREALPPLIEAVQQAGRNVVWASDPMHGNTTTTADGLKTRDFDRILAELDAAFDVHQAVGSILGGVHFEMTGEDVTECTGGAQGLSEADLSRNYATYCDPRLNSAQSLEMAFLLARRLRQRRA